MLATILFGETVCKSDPCSLGELFVAFDSFISYALTYLLIPFAVISIMWAGFLILTSAGNAGKVTKAKGILLWTVIGVAVALGAKFIVSLVASALTNGGFKIT